MADAVHIDPNAVREKLETIKFADADYLNMARVQLVEGLATDSLDEALCRPRYAPAPTAAFFAIWESAMCGQTWTRAECERSSTRPC